MGRPSSVNQAGQPAGPNTLMQSWAPAARSGTPFEQLSGQQQGDMLRFMMIGGAHRGKYPGKYYNTAAPNPMQPNASPSGSNAMPPVDPMMRPYR